MLSVTGNAYGHSDRALSAKLIALMDKTEGCHSGTYLAEIDFSTVWMIINSRIAVEVMNYQIKNIHNCHIK